MGFQKKPMNARLGVFEARLKQDLNPYNFTSNFLKYFLRSLFPLKIGKKHHD
jgi:hypothetical protein